jgi:3-deoxy-7-phosphoheptulonate synthase
MPTTSRDPVPAPPAPPRYPLTGRSPAADHTTVAFGRGERPVVIGGREIVVIAGPCSVEGPEMLRATAGAVRAAGAAALRGGAFKPRSSPYAFQGLGAAALEMLAQVRAETGLPIVTEVVDPRDVEQVAAVADVLQVGTRNMHNVPLLAEVGRSGKPVLLKRGFASRLDEFLLAAEYVMAAGNRDVILCERGIRTFETATRNTLDVSAVPVLKAETHLPVVVDPSHAGGKRALVAPLAYAAVAAGADGLLIEVHPEPDAALSDGDQSLAPDRFAALMRGLRPFAEAAGRTLAPPPAVARADRRAAAGAPAPTGAEQQALEALRGRIEETDHAILDLTARRAALARRAGGLKRALGLPLVDAGREREVERLMLDRARELGLPPADVHAITRALIALARSAQAGPEGDATRGDPDLEEP